METVPLPKINSFFKDRKPSKLFILMSIFYKIQVIWGFDYGFFNFKYTIANTLVKVLSFAISTSLIASYFYFYSFTASRYFIWLYLFLIKYILNVLFLLYLNSKFTFRRFHYDLQEIDSKVGFDSVLNIESKILLSGFLCFFKRILISVTYWFATDYYVRPLFMAVYYLGVLSNTDILLISYAFIFYAVNCRLKNLGTIIKQAKSDYSSHMYTYKLYVDFVEKYKRKFDPLQLISLSCTVPEIMATIFLSYFARNREPSSLKKIWAYNMEYTMVIEALASTLAPSFFAGMLTSQAEQIKLLLYDKLLEEKGDTDVADEIEMFIRYVKARPCRFRVWKVIPLDTDLIGMVISFCATYLIVLIQFEYRANT